MAEPRPLYPQEPERPVAEVGPRNESIGGLASELISDVGSLLRSEMQLARTEIRNDMAGLARGVALATVGGVIAVLGIACLLEAAIFGLGATMPLSTAALIIGIVVLVLGGILALVGVNQLRNAVPVPDETIESLREDARWLRNKPR